MSDKMWFDVWEYVQWTTLVLACLSSMFLLVHSISFHRLKRRMADFLLCVIGLSDFCFSALEALKQHVHLTYSGVYETDRTDAEVTAVELVASTISRFAFFMSLYWIANLSMLMRLGKIEDLHIRRNFLFSVFLALVYGAMHASLQAMDNVFAYAMNACILFMIQVAVLGTIVSNLHYVRWHSRMNENSHGRNVILRLTGYCICAALFTLPYSLVLMVYQRHVPLGVITETFNYFLPIANAILFGTGITCCWGAREGDLPEKLPPTKASKSSERTYSPSTVGPLTEMVTESPVVKVGEGSSAIVYRTQWLGITVAMKCIRLQGVSEDMEDLYLTHMSEIQTTFCDEAALAAQLRHPNITLFIKLGTYKGSMCLVNEYCSRGSLRDCLKANPLMEWSTKVRLAFEAAKGLAFMHNRDPIYLHRDLKASNILVTEDWTAKISDFGISRIATDYTLTTRRKAAFPIDSKQNEETRVLTTFAGTWRWNAPEIMANPNECHFNRATDIYSFGMALWEILTNGATPFGDVSFDHQVRTLVSNGERPKVPPVYVSRAPPEFVEIIKACWDQRPENRPTAQDVMLRLGSLSYSLYNSTEPSTRQTSRAVFSDNYYQALDSARSCVIDL
ncbi:hypothetical protein Poli38472_002827 [Pythium oligandrum]|uniref:Protein kinase domain-containing protein n=1 Tax=Pythium oligandrum TaxID=41045 RepID=A0A8K1C5I0_PYTOL|nr:hypothetical protein Poli38472_002827 [Pythium oligandrum]|eukprot:TMW56902.1 hypothetical protein Poli38472_002827 [Pythium oligandrum]